jgi:hypothetical protein
VIKLFKRPMVVVKRSSRLLRRIWKRTKKTKGAMNAMKAANQMGTTSFRTG